ncbi:tRNA pseudouridine(38-40) synthase TruA [bacterium]|nr:tRNA pseudouridine(38-40) synthase TruA [bacterium]
MRLRIDFSYDGTDFSGWAKQPGLHTVQGSLDVALATILRLDTIQSTVAGRTDAGVHATGQTAHIDVDDSVKPEQLLRQLNSILSGVAIHIHRVMVAPPGFDARYSPMFRRYEYRVSDAVGNRDPRTRNFTLWLDDHLDIDRMNAAATSILGLHDWTTYCKPRPRATRVRELQIFRWRREKDGTLVAEVQADAFCHNMVRNLVGMCIAVGRGKLTVSDAVKLREERARTSAFIVVPPHGLTLVEVGYPADDEVGERAELSRARRESV